MRGLSESCERNINTIEPLITQYRVSHKILHLDIDPLCIKLVFYLHQFLMKHLTFAVTFQGFLYLIAGGPAALKDRWTLTRIAFIPGKLNVIEMLLSAISCAY